MQYELRPRSMGEILDLSVQIYRNHFKAIFIGLAVPYLPFLLANSIVTPMMTGGGSTPGVGAIALTVVMGIVGVMALAVAAGSVGVLTRDALLGTELDLSRALAYAMRRAPALIGAGLLAYFAVVGGMLLLVIPGIIIGVRLMLILVPVALEEAGPVQAWKRSWRLIRDCPPSTVWAAFFGWVIPMLISTGVSWAVPQAIRAIPVAGGVIGMLPALFLTPLCFVVDVVAYFDCRIRLEGLDLQMRAQALAVPHDGPPPTASA